MTVSQRLHGQVALVVLLVSALAATGWFLVPAKANTWMIGLATMAGIWIVVTAIGMARPFAEHSVSERRYLLLSVSAAGAIIAAALLKKLVLGLGLDDGMVTDRAVGIGSGLVLLLLGNTLPKVLSPLAAKRCAASQVQSIQRFAGWSFVLAGFVCIGAWLIAPIDQAGDWSMIATATALALVLLRYAWAFMAPAARSTVRD